MDRYTPPSVAYGGAYAIRPDDRIRAILRNTDAIFQLNTCGPSKNHPIFVPFGAVEWAYAIRPYDRVCAALRKTTPFSSPSGPLVGRIRYAPTTGYVRSFEIPMQFSNWVRVALQKTILFSSSSGPRSGYIQYAPTIGYVRFFEIPMRFPNRVCAILQNTDAIPQLGTCEGSKNGSVYATVGGVWWGVFNTPLRPGTCDPSKYRCDSPIGYA